MRVVGTAGHVDHGKSTLVAKLSGINPDRLAEEQSRQMTIDLGFAWLDLPDGETIGIVDVPGHRDFIENMLAGVGGIDAALLVIAADEGIMPQTREHLSILGLLDVKKVLVVLSKIDLIDDPEWIELVELEVEELLASSQYEDTPIIPVSAHSGAGLPELLKSLQALLDGLPQRVNYQQPRLPVDRVFVVSGFGTVVTGTLNGGSLSIGDAVEAQPSGRIGRVRGLQSYKREVKIALPGSRVAINVAGVSSYQIQRGHVLTYPGQLSPTLLADAHFRQLPDIERPLKHNSEVKVFCGASESIARVRLLDSDALAPGESGWLQLRLRAPAALSRGDRFILRYPSPAETLGGGVIVNASAPRRLKRFQPEIIAALELRLRGTPGERLAQAAEADAPQRLGDLQKKLGYGREELAAALDEALQAGLVRRLDRDMLWATKSCQHLSHAIIAALNEYHLSQPLRLGMPRAELPSRLKTKMKLLHALIEADDRLVLDGNFLRAADHDIVFNDQQQAGIDRLRQSLEANPYMPPSIAEMNALAGEDVVRALLDLRQLVNVSENIAFSLEAYERMVAEIRREISQQEEIDAKTLRDMFGTTRKYAIPFLEHLDSIGVTQRVGDARVPGRNF